ncbi:MAG TPA: glycosyltransferase [Caulobacteraceae bacterium]
MSERTPWITACIPTFRAHRYLRQSVLSLLGQTHWKVRVVVINDGDGSSPWPMLSDIGDPRLVRFDIAPNRGPYFCRAIAAAATVDDWLFVQDADDWSAPEHLAHLLSACLDTRADFAFATQSQYVESPGGLAFHSRAFPAGPRPVDRALLYRAPHHGLFRRRFLQEIGGLFCGYRFGYDLLLMNLVLMAGTIAWVNAPLCCRRLRAGSLTEASETGYGSLGRQAVDAQLARIYSSVFEAYGVYRQGRITIDGLRSRIRALVDYNAAGDDRAAIAALASRLRSGLQFQSRLMTVDEALTDVW